MESLKKCAVDVLNNFLEPLDGFNGQRSIDHATIFSCINFPKIENASKGFLQIVVKHLNDEIAILKRVLRVPGSDGIDGKKILLSGEWYRLVSIFFFIT